MPKKQKSYKLLFLIKELFMAGHSKWANIKHRKARQDASKGKVFTKYLREIVVAAQMGGGNEADNPRLRAIVSKALSANMTRDVINRAIQRGVGGNDGEKVQEITYEGYGMGGVAVLVETMTDNLKRTVSDVRHAFVKCGGNLGTSGSVDYLFTKRGELSFVDVDEDKIMEVALEAGAEDVISEEDGSVMVITSPYTFGQIQDALEAAGFKAVHAEVTMHAATQAEITDIEQAQKIIKMIDMLEDSDDVQNVYSNVHFSDAVMEALNK
jgi:YebC/PmpR family DNA-binding regulatory protein